MNANSRVQDEEFLRSVTFSVEEFRKQFPWTPWNGGYRWFKSPKVVDLWSHYNEAQRFEIYQRLRRIGFSSKAAGEAAQIKNLKLPFK